MHLLKGPTNHKVANVVFFILHFLSLLNLAIICVPKPMCINLDTTEQNTSETHLSSGPL